MELSYIWPFTAYKVSEMYKRYFGNAIQVQTSHGPIQGVEVTSTFGYKYTGFQGVPYGKAPVGELRFKDPQPPEPWTTMLQATSESMAVQQDIFFKKTAGTEDCLHLNVYTKELGQQSTESQTLRPVMVWFHGGAFIFGSNTKDIYNPEFLLKRDIVLVVVNYRLGAFGFLSVDDESVDVPGNAGLKDQVLALKWIRDNIERFGGDPNNVTLFGESAGGCSVHFHMLSEMSKGLFHKAILMSGTALNPWSVCPMKNLPERLAKGVGWTGEGGSKQMMKVLRAASTDSIIKVQNTIITKEEQRQFILFPFGPVKEPYVSSQCMITEDPLQSCRNTWSYQIPTVYSACADEGLLLYKITKKKPKFLAGLSEEFERIVPLDLESNRSSDKCKELGAAFKKFYYGFTEPSWANIFTYTQLIGDKLFWHGIHRSILSRMSYENVAPTYLLRFDYDSEVMNLSKFMFAGRGIKGVCHADDCGYLFKNCITSRIPGDAKEFKTIDRMVNYLTSFAKTGDPNAEASESTVHWDPIEAGKPLKCLNLSQEPTFVDLPENDRMHFWDAVYKRAGVKII